jgi:hypothetical protein
MSGGEVAFWAVAALVVATPVYAVACALWPFTACDRCDGSGRRRSPSGRNYGRCRKCKGRGEQLRLGRRVMNRLGVAKDKLIG